MSTTFVKGNQYRWKHDKKHPLIYRGKKGAWHQFSLVSKPGDIWCEVLSEDLRMLEAVVTEEENARQE